MAINLDDHVRIKGQSFFGNELIHNFSEYCQLFIGWCGFVVVILLIKTCNVHHISMIVGLSEFYPFILSMSECRMFKLECVKSGNCTILNSITNNIILENKCNYIIDNRPRIWFGN